MHWVRRRVSEQEELRNRLQIDWIHDAMCRHIILAGRQLCPSQGTPGDRLLEKKLRHAVGSTVADRRPISNIRAAEGSVRALFQVGLADSLLARRQCGIVDLSTVAAFGSRYRPVSDVPLHVGHRHRLRKRTRAILSVEVRIDGCTVIVDEVRSVA